MTPAQLLASYVLRVIVRRDHCRIQLDRIGTGEHRDFASFKELCGYLETSDVQRRLELLARLREGEPGE